MLKRKKVSKPKKSKKAKKRSKKELMDVTFHVTNTPFLVTDIGSLRSLERLHPNTRIRAYKYTNGSGLPPYKNRLWKGRPSYKIDEIFDEPNYNTDRSSSCGAGLNVATKRWCQGDSNHIGRLWMVEFLRKDIACIPNSTDGKFRVKKLKVVAELSWDF